MTIKFLGVSSGIGGASTDTTGRPSASGLKVGTSASLFDITAGGSAVETVTVDAQGKATFTTAKMTGHAYVIDGTIRIDAGSGAVVTPAAPSIALTAGNGQVSIAWTDGVNGGSAITSHKLYRAIAAGALVLLGTITTGSPFVDTGLTNGTAYTYALTAVNGVGESVASAQASATPSAVPINTAVQVVGTPNRFPDGQAGAVGANRAFFIRQPIYIGSGDAKSLILSFANAFATQTTGQTGSALTITKAAIEVDGGVTVPVTFSGARNTTIPFGTTDINSDPVAASAFSLSVIPRGQLCWLRVQGSVAASTDKWLTQYNRPSITGAQQLVFDPTVVADAGVDGTGLVATTNATVASNLPGPILLGTFVNPGLDSFVGVGDSIFRNSDTEAANFNFPLRLFSGMFERATLDGASTPASMIASLNMGVYGSSVDGYTAAGDYRKSYYKYATKVIDEYGTNSGAILANMQTDLGNLWTAIKAAGAQIIRTKILQRAGSTDNFATNQTVSTSYGPGEKFDLLNQWFDTKQADGTLLAVFQNGSGRDPINPYVWRLNGQSNWNTNDGTHPSPPAGVPLMAAEMRRNILGLTATAAPAAPTLTTAQSDTTITATWPAPAQPVQNVIAEIKPSSGSTYTKVQTYDNATAFAFTGLTAGTSYDIRVSLQNYKGVSTLATATVSTAATPTGLLLDGLTLAPQVGLSSRRLRSGYTGAAMTVVRTIDMREADVWFTGAGDLDTAFLTAWSLGGDVLVRRRYDQAVGGANTFTAASTSNSRAFYPTLMTAGVLKTVNGKAAELLTGSNGYQVTALTAVPTARHTAVVVRPTSLANSDNGILGGGNGGGLGLEVRSGGTYRLTQMFGTLIGDVGGAAVNTTAQVNASFNNGTGAYSLQRDGGTAVAGTQSITYSNGGTANLGTFKTGDGYGGFTGYIPELIDYETTLPAAADIAAIAAGQKTYWATP